MRCTLSAAFTLSLVLLLAGCTPSTPPRHPTVETPRKATAPSIPTVPAPLIASPRGWIVPAASAESGWAPIRDGVEITPDSASSTSFEVAYTREKGTTWGVAFMLPDGAVSSLRSLVIVASAAPDQRLVVCMIETAEGLRNVDEIAAVEGVDVILIGLTDLLYSLGKPGALDDPAVMDAVDRAAAAARNHGKVLGLGGDTDPQRQAEYLKRGVRFFTLPSDGAFVLSAASASARSLRALAAA